MDDTLDDGEGATIELQRPREIRWLWAAQTHVGRVRRINEDNLMERGDIGLWAVADGVGGERAGDRASALVAEALNKVGIPQTAAGFLAEVRDNLQAVNHLLRLESATTGDGRVIASTVVALLAFGQHFACAWAGDSRLYLLRNHRLKQITRDHSEVQEMVDAGLLTPEQARTHPRVNVVTRAVGAEDTLTLEMVQDQIRVGDLFLLCSDGLTKMIADDEIATLLARRPVEAATDALIQTTLERGAPDNVTVVLVEAAAADDG